MDSQGMEKTMNRRELLKFSLFSPLLGLFKGRKSGASTGLTVDKLVTYKDVLDDCPSTLKDVELIPRTTGTSSEDEILYQGFVQEKTGIITTVPLGENWTISTMEMSYPEMVVTIYGHKT
jgi:hypothetical protein